MGLWSLHVYKDYGVRPCTPLHIQAHGVNQRSSFNPPRTREDYTMVPDGRPFTGAHGTGQLSNAAFAMEVSRRCFLVTSVGRPRARSQ